MIEDEEAVRFDWRRGGAAAVGLVAALVLVLMVFAVKFANDARERALVAERQASQVALLVRNVSANVSRADAALARFTLDEDVQGSGNVYSSAWQLAGFQISVEITAYARSNLSIASSRRPRFASTEASQPEARAAACVSPISS